VKGYEVAYQQYYDFLPGVLKGIGVQANFTYVDSQGVKNAATDPYDPTQIAGASVPNLPLAGLSRDSYNLAALYDLGPVSARLAYNWRSEYLMTTSAANVNIPAWAAAYGQLDGSIFYTFSPKLKVGFQATNLTGEIFKTLVSYPTTVNNPGQTGSTWVDSDRRFVITVRGQF
jgi:TonB-dependent receptor